MQFGRRCNGWFVGRMNWSDRVGFSFAWNRRRWQSGIVHIRLDTESNLKKATGQSELSGEGHGEVKNGIHQLVHSDLK